MLSRFASKPYGGFILGFLAAALLTTSLDTPGLDDSATTNNNDASTVTVDDPGVEPVQVSARSIAAARLWADLLTDRWDHIIDPLSFDNFTVEYCVRRKAAVRDLSSPYMDVAAAGAVDDWARASLGYEHRTKQDRHTVASLVMAMGYGCAGTA